MRRVKDALPIEEAAAALPAHAAREAAVRLGRTLRRMHDRGLRHRDLKKDNVLVAPGVEERGAGGPGFFFLDLDGVREGRRALDWERRAKDLAKLGGSLLDFGRVPTGLRLRALDAYLGGETPPGFPPGGFARLVMRLAAAVRARRLAAAPGTPSGPAAPDAPSDPAPAAGAAADAPSHPAAPEAPS
jgi:hypothetical protein